MHIYSIETTRLFCAIIYAVKGMMDMRKITDELYWVGVNDNEIDLFEGQYPVPNGMAYNSYIIRDEKTAVFDSVEKRFGNEWLRNIEEVMGDKSPDYLIVQHMEPDHSANIMAFAGKYPEAKIVGNAKTYKFMEQFFGDSLANRQLIVKDGDILNLGKHELTFVFAPMVHWPEVMMTYDKTSKTFFSADAFGKFGSFDADEDWLDEARRYYIGIVGKFGAQVQSLLKKAGELDIQRICSLHGPVLEDKVKEALEKYSVWSSYETEKDGVLIAYTSIYGHTKEAVKLLEEKLKNKSVDVKTFDLARCDMSEAVAQAFAYGKIVFASTTYNNELFPPVREYISELAERNFQNKVIGIIENGTWGPQVAKRIKDAFENSKDISFADNTVSIKSAVSEENRIQAEALAEELSK